MPAIHHETQHDSTGAPLPVRVAVTVDAVVISWNNYVSHCKNCGRVILKSHPWRWSTTPMGIVHVDCPEGDWR